MKYNAPAGAESNAPYVDGNRNAGVKGSIPPAGAIEHPQRELEHLIRFAGLTPSGTDLEQVRKAIELLIDAATGGGNVSQYLLVSQARARLPIYPEILSDDGVMNVSSPAAGSVLVPPTVSFMHRGIFPVNTSDFSEAQRSFATAPNKTYHLRWSPAAGFALRDLADGSYNPGSLVETNVTFDTGYDDMLIAKVTTGPNNIATITNLANKNILKYSYDRDSLVYSIGGGGLVPPGAMEEATETISYNFARTPQFNINSFSESFINVVPTSVTDGSETNIFASNLTRYSTAVFTYSWSHIHSRGGRPRYAATLLAVG